MSVQEDFEREWAVSGMPKDKQRLVRAAFEACAAQHEAERNSLLAVNEKQQEALKRIDHKLLSANEAITPTDHKLVEEALALTPDSVRLVPLTHLKFRAAQSWSGNFEHGPESHEWLEQCMPDDVGDDGVKAVQVYTIVEGKAE